MPLRRIHKVVSMFIALFASAVCAADEFGFVDGWTIGGNGDEFIQDVAWDNSGNIYLAGTFGSNTIDLDPSSGFKYATRNGEDDLFIVKLSKQGKFLWAIQYGTSQTEYGTQIEVDKDNNVVIGGSYFGRMDLDPGPKQDMQGFSGVRSAFFTKLDSNGKYIWGHSFTASGATTLSELKVDDENNIFISGMYSDNIDMDPGPNYVVLVVSNNQSNGIYLAKYKPNSDIIWAKGFNGRGFKVGEDIAIGKQGQIAMTGYFTGTMDVDPDARTEYINSLSNYDGFILQVDSTGDLEWSGHYIGKGNALGRAVAISDSGIVYCSGSFNDTVDIHPGFVTKKGRSPGYADFWVTKFKKSGDVIWTEALGGKRDDVVSAIECKGETGLFLAGTFYNEIDIDPDTGSYVLRGNINTAMVFLTDSALRPMDHSVFTGNGSGYIYEIDLNNSGEILTAGSFNKSIDLDPGKDTLSAASNGGFDGMSQILLTCNNEIIPVVINLPDTSAICGFESALAPKAWSECAGTLTATTSTSFPIQGRDTTLVTWIFDDGNGSTFQQQQRFIVTDEVAPVPDLSDLPDVVSRCPILMANIPTATDNCGGRIAGRSSVAFPIDEEGVTMVTWTFLDAMGNESTHQQKYEYKPYDLTYTIQSPRLIANEPDAKYQWMDCNDRFAKIEGATEREFTPEVNGRYAVRLSVGSCVELLECIEVSNVGLEEMSKARIKVYPNPLRDGSFHVEGAYPLSLQDIQGRQIRFLLNQNVEADRYSGVIENDVAPGFYIFKLQTSEGIVRHMITVK